MASFASIQPLVVTISAVQVKNLDLSPLNSWAALEPSELLDKAGQLELVFSWDRQADDPRELSEIPELRLWTLRADAIYPWLPWVLKRSGGQLCRHVAMLLPHGFHPNDGIYFGSESLDLWIPHRLFWLDAWSRQAGLNCRQGLAQMAAVLGFELDPSFWTNIS